MVAMAIFALALAAIYATWTLILRGSASGLRAAAQAQRERTAVRVIEETLGSVRSFAADVQHYSFVMENGEEASLSFVARLPKAFPRGGRFADFDVRRVMFSLESSEEGDRRLVLRQWPVLMEMDEDEQQHPLVLARDVQEFTIEAWDTQQGDWTDVWEQTNQIPTLVRVALSFSQPGHPSSYARPIEQVSRVMALSSITVPATWQTPSRQGGPSNTRPGGPFGQDGAAGKGSQGGQGTIRVPGVQPR
jgi:hypothetical protein